MTGTVTRGCPGSVRGRRPLVRPRTAVDAFVASGHDDSEFIDMAELRGRRR
ncbi:MULTISPECIES: hypothetical protein [unclassified Streptomyces]|uniref:hypothetical protein n=1 Tax=unclassified Streptomyces TaxID=2593676 RepID=UPI0036C772E6